jgi:ketosteroid isomerase-like protein
MPPPLITCPLSYVRRLSLKRREDATSVSVDASRSARDVVLDDATWAHVPGNDEWKDDGRRQSNRMRACINAAIQLVRDEQQPTENILVEVLGVMVGGRPSSVLHPPVRIAL